MENKIESKIKHYKAQLIKNLTCFPPWTSVILISASISSDN